MVDLKPLRDMSLEEIASLRATKFRELADDHNDHLELKESAHQRHLDEKSRMVNSQTGLPNPDTEIDKVLLGLLEPRPHQEEAAPPERKTLVQAVAGAVKQWKAQKDEDIYERLTRERAGRSAGADIEHKPSSERDRDPGHDRW